LTNELVSKIYLIQEESIRRLYQQRLARNLSKYTKASTIDKEWENIKTSIKKAANEAIETKKYIEERKVKNLERGDNKCHCKQTNTLPNIPTKL
jgi:hypothetical protein